MEVAALNVIRRFFCVLPLKNELRHVRNRIDDQIVRWFLSVPRCSRVLGRSSPGASLGLPLCKLELLDYIARSALARLSQEQVRWPAARQVRKHQTQAPWIPHSVQSHMFVTRVTVRWIVLQPRWCIRSILRRILPTYMYYWCSQFIKPATELGTTSIEKAPIHIYTSHAEPDKHNPMYQSKTYHSVLAISWSRFRPIDLRIWIYA